MSKKQRPDKGKAKSESKASGKASGKAGDAKAQKKAQKKTRKAERKAERREQNQSSPLPLLRKTSLQYLSAAVTGTLLFLACADFDIWPLAWLGFVPVLIFARDVSPRRAFMLGWMAGLVGNAGGFYWITTLLVRFGKMPFAVALVLFLLLVAYQGLHWGVFTYLLRRVRMSGLTVRGRPLPATLLAPLFMAALELVMPFVFDWYLSITQAWVVPVIQVADFSGPLGTTFLLMMVNGMIFDVVDGLWLQPAHGSERRVPWRALAAGVAVLAAALIYGAVRIAQVDQMRARAKKVKIGVVQANLGINQKGRSYLAVRHHELHIRESRRLQEAGAELIVWPESSYPFAFYRHMKRDFRRGDLRRIMQGIRVPLLFGAITLGRGEPYPYNTAYMMEPDGRITGRFDKNFLLIFGEYIPFYDKLPWFRKVFPAASHFARGKEVTTFPFRDQKIGPMICYEDILPAFGRRVAKLQPNLLVNITNDAWFGATSEPWEHLALAVFRAVETRLDLVRAVNTGVSAFIDANGRVLKTTKSYDPVVTPGVPPSRLLGESAFLPGEPTIYTRVGNLFGYLCLAGLLLICGLAWRRQRATS